MTKKRIDRAANRRGIRQQENALRAAVHAYWDDQDADFANLIETAVKDEQFTATKAIALAARTIDELATATGESRDDVLRRFVP